MRRTLRLTLGLFTTLGLLHCGGRTPITAGEVFCQDGVDNDRDGLADCQDPDCVEEDHCGGPICGDDRIETGEQCEGQNLAGQTCDSLGLGGGQLGCTQLCQFDTRGCEGITCGNGIMDVGEECDGGDLGNQRCQDLGFTGGVLSCQADCTLNDSYCYLCGNDECESAKGEDDQNCPADCGILWIQASTGYTPIFQHVHGATHQRARAILFMPSGLATYSARISGEGQNSDCQDIPRTMIVEINDEGFEVLDHIENGFTESFDIALPAGTLVDGDNDVEAYIDWADALYDCGHRVTLTLWIGN